MDFDDTFGYLSLFESKKGSLPESLSSLGSDAEIKYVDYLEPPPSGGRRIFIDMR